MYEWQVDCWTGSGQPVLKRNYLYEKNISEKKENHSKREQGGGERKEKKD